MSAKGKVQRLDDHVLDADVLTNEVGAWFAHEHEHEHPDKSLSSIIHVPQRHKHRHDHRRRSTRGDYDHHAIEQPGTATP